MERDEVLLEDPVNEAGGGVIDVAGFALRVSALLLQKPQRRRLIVMDEPFRFLSADRRHTIPVMLEYLAEEFDLQFVFITHMEELTIGKVIQVTSLR